MEKNESFMKRIIAIVLVFMVVSLASCGESVICDWCDEEVKEYNIRQNVYEEETYNVCRDCYDFIEDYNKGNIVECDFCSEYVKRDKARFNDLLEIYICDECYRELHS